MKGVEIDTKDHFKEPLIRYSACMKIERRRFLDTLQKLVNKRVIKSPNVQHLEFKGLKIVVSVFEAFKSDPKALLPRDTCQIYETDGQDIRVICDYIAGMTDGYLLKTYDRLFSPRMGSIFDKL
jgi:dGTPase